MDEEIDPTTVPVRRADIVPVLTEAQKERLREAARTMPKFKAFRDVFPFVES